MLFGKQAPFTSFLSGQQVAAGTLGCNKHWAACTRYTGKVFFPSPPRHVFVPLSLLENFQCLNTPWSCLLAPSRSHTDHPIFYSKCAYLDSAIEISSSQELHLTQRTEPEQDKQGSPPAAQPQFLTEDNVEYIYSK